MKYASSIVANCININIFNGNAKYNYIIREGRVFMKNISEVNEKVCRILRDENNEVIYKAWLSFAEDAQYEDNNIVINVPNNYIKETMETRYYEDLEALYKEDLDFSKLLIRAKDHMNFTSAALACSSPGNLQMGFIPDYKSYICW